VPTRAREGGWRFYLHFLRLGAFGSGAVAMITPGPVVITDAVERDDRLKNSANLPGATESVVSYRDARSVVSRIAITPCAGNYPMALEEWASRLLAGCRRPARLAILDTSAGKPISEVKIVGETDDCFMTPARDGLPAEIRVVERSSR
jgi:hypothetical protein